MSAAWDSPELNALTAIVAESEGRGGRATKGDRMVALGLSNKLGDRGFAIAPARLGYVAVKTAALALPDAEKRLLANLLQQSAGAEIVPFPYPVRRPSPGPQDAA